MPTPLYEKEKEVALAAVIQASELAREMQGKLDALDVVNKEDLSPVTITDFSVQALINLHLAQSFPHDEIMGEEDSLFLRNPLHQVINKKVTAQIKNFFPSIQEHEILEAIDRGGSEGGPNKRFWVLDPIDGTRGFIHHEQYAIALALIEDGEVVLGVLGCPRYPLKDHHKGGIFVAIKGHGCTMTPYGTNETFTMQVNMDPKRETMIYCEPHSSSRTHSHSKALEVANLLKADPKPFRLDSQCKYAYVAAGDAEIYLRIPFQESNNEKIWDHAAGMLIVEEAGGKVTDLKGKRLNFALGKTLAANSGIVASNSSLHEETIRAIGKVL